MREQGVFYEVRRGQFILSRPTTCFSTDQKKSQLP